MTKKFTLLILVVIAGLFFDFNHGAQAVPRSTAKIIANDSNQDITVPSGSSVKITWSSTNATSCDVDKNGTVLWSDTGNTRYSTVTSFSRFTINCHGAGGDSTDHVDVSMTASPTPTATITINDSHSPAPVVSGTSVKVTWSSTNATSCDVYWGDASNEGFIIWSDTGNTRYATITSYTRFRFYCYGSGGTAFDQASVDVATPPTVSANISCNPSTVAYGGASNVSWSSTNASSCTGAPSGGTGPSGSFNTGNLTTSQTYSVTCNR